MWGLGLRVQGLGINKGSGFVNEFVRALGR